MNEIRAIETEYAGCRFRSRLEARWAVFFDHLGIEWEHEPEGYATSVGNYLPDFRIHVPGDSYPYWFEVKPPGALYDDRHRVLCIETATPTIVARDMPRDYMRQWSHLTAMLWGDRLSGAKFPAGNARPEVHQVGFIGPAHSWVWPVDETTPGWDVIYKARVFVDTTEDRAHVALESTWAPDSSSDVDAAYRAARSARFGT